MNDRPGDCCFDGWASANAKRARRRETAARITGRLVEALERAGLEGRTVLDLGCGAGDLALTTLARGAAAATGLDLGAGAVASARSLATTRGLAARARFEVGDAAVAPLSRHDVVVLNRVLCCYHDPGPLLDNALGATGSVFAMTAPVDRGLGGAWNRFLTASGNLWYAARRARYRGFRVFVHPLEPVAAMVGRAGLAPLVHERHGLWDMTVYVRDGVR
jgi:magnesium-protoporphyrin O-methyltransferase